MGLHTRYLLPSKINLRWVGGYQVIPPAAWRASGRLLYTWLSPTAVLACTLMALEVQHMELCPFQEKPGVLASTISLRQYSPRVRTSSTFVLASSEYPGAPCSTHGDPGGDNFSSPTRPLCSTSHKICRKPIHGDFENLPVLLFRVDFSSFCYGCFHVLPPSA